MATRRQVLGQTFAFVATAAVGPAFGQSPNMKFIVPGGVSTATDTVARFMARAMEKAMNTTVVVENYPGGGGVIGTTLASKAAPDGNTVLVFNSNFFVAPWVNNNVQYDPIEDFEPVATFGRTVQLLIVGPNSPYSSLKDIIAAGRKPGSDLSYASVGNGTLSHLSGELLNSIAGTKLRHIPYKTPSQAVTDVSSGTVTLGFIGPAAALGLIKAGRLKVIASSGPRRSIYFPDVPTFAEAGAPGYEITVPVIVMVPAGTPTPVIERLAKVMTETAATPAFREFLATQSMEPEIVSTKEFAANIKREAEMWKKLVETAKAKAS